MKTLKYLVGPFSAQAADNVWQGPRASGECRAFNATGDTDLRVSPADTWEDVLGRLPEGWRPDCVVLDLGYTTVPAGLWAAPVPLVGLAKDWNLLWHHYRQAVPRCDLVFTDAPGVERMHRAGWDHVRAGQLFGLGHDFLGAAAPDEHTPRDLDLLFVGNLHPAVQRERLVWLGRLAALGRRWRVAIATGVFGDAYRTLLRRARIVFNRSLRGECNMRAFEAAWAGALLFQERGNAEAETLFRDRQDCVFYGADDLEPLLEHYLTHEEERRAIAARAQRRVRDFSCERFWADMRETLHAEWALLEVRARQRASRGPRDLWTARLWQALGAAPGTDPDLLCDLTAAAPAGGAPAALHHARGVAVALWDGSRTATSARRAAEHFRLALWADPRHALAALNLVEALSLAGEQERAVEEARRLLASLERGATCRADVLDTPHFPPGFDYFRVEWERAAWEHAGAGAGEVQAKRDLLRWRLHALLADLTGALEHFQQSAELRPDLPISRAALGCALARAGQLAEAVPHLRAAVTANPFDRAAARSLFEALGQAGDATGQRNFAQERQRLSQAAPRVVPAEPWFAEEPAPACLPPGARAAVRALPRADFHQRFGNPDTARAVHAFTPPQDTHVVLTLLAQARPRRILEVGTAAGHMTANLTEWSPPDAVIFSLGTVADLHPASGPQAPENPPRAAFGRYAGQFGRADKVFFVTADSLGYDFSRLGPLDFAFLDGARDLQHVLSDTRNAYRQLVPGGCLVWHDVGSTTPWVEVDAALAQAGLPEPIYHVEGTGVAFLHKAGGLTSATSAPAAARSAPVAVVWEGALAESHSLALVNRELCRRLIGRGHEVSLRPHEAPPAAGVPRQSLPPLLADRVGHPLSRPADIHVRHFWPPDWTPPSSGHWVVIQPWEFGSIPRSWVEPLREAVDELWVPSRFVRDCYLASGVPADRVQVVPNGVDTDLYHPGAQPYALRTGKRCKLLFVGGTIFRKGIDVLLAAYARAFTNQDDVCLVVKDMGAGSFYRGQTAEGLLAKLRETPDAPEVEYLGGDLTPEEMAGLYIACDCLVQPYRGEGFGLPIAEAMACGLPVIVTDAGACRDFCDEANAWLVPARPVRFRAKRVGDLETVDYPWLSEPDPAALAGLLRRAYKNPEEGRAKGAVGRQRILAQFTWDHAVAAVEQRLEVLRRQRPRRLAGGADEVGPVLVARGTGRPRVSLCLIVKNEEENLPACLGSATDLADEVIVVDTGSSDRTKEVAARFGARVFDFPWVDSFAAARNECLRHATGDWIFWLDADDRLDEDNRAKLRALFAQLGVENAAYSMKCLCLPDKATGTVTVVDHVRLFRNHPAIRWDYRVHEQILPAVRKVGGAVRWADVTIQHAGYQDPALRGRKLQRDLRLLELDHADRPDDPFTLFNLGSVYQELGRYAEGLPLLRRSLELSHPNDSIVRKLYALIVQCHRNLGQPGEALAVCRKGLEVCPEDIELLFVEGVLLREHGDLAGAERSLRRLLDVRPAGHFASVDAGLQGYKARHNLGVVYHQQGRAEEALAQWRAAVAERLDFLPGWLGLAEGCLRLQRWPQLEEVLGRLEQLPPHGLTEAALFRARAHLARREFEQAQGLLEGVIGQHPQALEPRVVLSHVLLQEGSDPDAAERALRDVLALAPEHAEAKHNLALLRQQRQAAAP
jgi:glycosyltransferase involved in cell wall biosynthesis/tetratricopeptide (TPR) repeat protein/predicted O-methyltransferase YrrM